MIGPAEKLFRKERTGEGSDENEKDDGLHGEISRLGHLQKPINFHFRFRLGNNVTGVSGYGHGAVNFNRFGGQGVHREVSGTESSNWHRLPAANGKREFYEPGSLQASSLRARTP